MRITVSSPVPATPTGEHSQPVLPSLVCPPGAKSVSLLQLPDPSPAQCVLLCLLLRTPIHGVSLLNRRSQCYYSACLQETGQKRIFLQPELIRKSWKSMQAHGPKCIGCLILPPTAA